MAGFNNIYSLLTLLQRAISASRQRGFQDTPYRFGNIPRSLQRPTNVTPPTASPPVAPTKVAAPYMSQYDFAGTPESRFSNYQSLRTMPSYQNQNLPNFNSASDFDSWLQTQANPAFASLFRNTPTTTGPVIAGPGLGWETTPREVPTPSLTPMGGGIQVPTQAQQDWDMFMSPGNQSWRDSFQFPQDLMFAQDMIQGPNGLISRSQQYMFNEWLKQRPQTPGKSFGSGGIGAALEQLQTPIQGTMAPISAPTPAPTSTPSFTAPSNPVAPMSGFAAPSLFGRAAPSVNMTGLNNTLATLRRLFGGR